MKDKIWRVEKTRTIHRDRWVNLRADDCVRPDGVEIKPYYVLDYPDWAQVIAITPQEEIVLVRQYRHGMGAMTLELPSGVIDPGDASPEAAGARELLEETGYACDSMRLVGFTWNNPASCTNKVFALLGEGARPVAAQNLELTEDIAVETMPLAQAVDVAANGGFAHCAQVASLFLALRARGALG